MTGFSRRFVATLLLALCVFAPVMGVEPADQDDPRSWEETIRSFEDAAKVQPEPQGAVVFIGSSSIRFWSSLKEDMAPIAVIQRGFGGSRLADAAYYAKRLVNAYRPRAVVLFSGSNDITPERAKSPEVMLATFKEFVKNVRADLPGVPIYYIEITPSPLRWSVWNAARDTNRVIREYAAREKNLRVIDLSPFFFGANGEPDPQYYRDDRLHMSAAGYQIWKREIKARLLQDMPQLARR
jgi:lysophospholipase L1-like esterase